MVERSRHGTAQISDLSNTEELDASHYADAIPPPESDAYVPSRRVLVVGAGPAGQSAAIALRERGHKAILVDKRAEFTRPQRVMLTPETVQKMKDCAVPGNKYQQAILDELSKKGAVQSIQLKDIQKFFDISIVHNPGLKGQITVMQGQGELGEIDLDERVASVVSLDGSAQTIHFDDMLDASGGAELPLTRGGVPYKIERQQLELQPRQRAQSAMSYQTKKGTQTKRHLNEGDLAVLAELGWKKPDPPKNYIISNSSKSKHSVGGEIPSRILAEPNENQRKILTEQWWKTILALRYGKKATDFKSYKEEKELDTERKQTKKRLATSVFPMELSYAQQSAFKIGNEENGTGTGTHAIVGNGALIPNFHTGLGLNFAVASGHKFAESLGNGGDSFDYAGFEAHQGSQRAEMTARMIQGEREELDSYAERAERLLQAPDFYDPLKQVSLVEQFQNKLLPRLQALQLAMEDINSPELAERLNGLVKELEQGASVDPANMVQSVVGIVKEFEEHLVDQAKPALRQTGLRAMSGLLSSFQRAGIVAG